MFSSAFDYTLELYFVFEDILARSVLHEIITDLYGPFHFLSKMLQATEKHWHIPCSQLRQS